MAGNNFGMGPAAPGMSNPYLQDQANAIRAQHQQLFGDMNNDIRSGAIAAGGLGGSRQGVAQGVGMARATTGLDSALSQMYAQAYDSDQNRQTQTGIAGMNNATQTGIARMGNDTTRYGINQQTGLGYAGLQNQYGIASMNNDTSRYGIDTNNATQRYGYDTSANTQRYLGDQSQATALRGQDISWQNNVNNFNLGQQQNANTRYGLENQYNLGLGQNQNQADSIRNNFYTQQRQGDQAAWDGAANLYSNTLRTAAGAGNGTNGSSGFDWSGAVGGGLAGLQWAKNNGWWGS